MWYTWGVIPETMKAMRQWVVWRAVPRGGKLTKVPVNPHTGRNASSTAPYTWGSFVEAERALSRFNATGLGFVFSADDLFAGIDLDGCRDPNTGDVDGWAQDIVDRLDSFTEISPSGRGLHVIVRADKPAGRCRIDGIEMYDRGRFFCVTGDHVEGAPGFVEDRQAEVSDLFADVFGESRPIARRAARTRRVRQADSTLEPIVLARTVGLVMYQNDSRIFI